MPKASCAPGGRPEAGLQGEVSLEDIGFLREGARCNLEPVGQYVGDGANLQLAWYEDCAYTATLYLPDDPEYQQRKGTVVIDVSNPRRPLPVGRLQSPAMVSPHESLKVNKRRGLLAADEGLPHPDSVGSGWRHPASTSTSTTSAATAGIRSCVAARSL